MAYTLKACFNHPMVKVKAKMAMDTTLNFPGFNHPMVKVKGVY